MKLQRLAIALIAAVAMSASAQADEIFSFGDLPLAPGETSSAVTGTVSETILGIDVAFLYTTSADGSWSSDYFATITDPSGDVINLGDGLGNGDIDYSAGTPSGPDGSQSDSTAGGDYGTFFDIADIQAIVPTFGEAGTYSVTFADGWTGGSNTETLGSATVTIATQAIPEPAGLMALAAIGGVALIRRRR